MLDKKWKFRLTCKNCRHHTKAPKSASYINKFNLICVKCRELSDHNIVIMKFNSKYTWWKPYTWKNGKWVAWKWID